MHLIFREVFHIQLPKNFLSFETYTYGQPIKQEDIEPGDIFLFGKSDEADFKKLHIALYTGRRDERTNEPMLIHANYIDKKVSEWMLSQFSQYQRYSTLYGIRRITPEAVEKFMIDQPQLPFPS